MREIFGDLWNEHVDGSVIVISTNGVVARTGKSVMLRGCARQAAIRYPEILKTHGTLLLSHGNHVFDLGSKIVSFPVEEDPYQNPDIRLIEQSCKELVGLANDKDWQKIIVPRPGCGGGGLSWADVEPVLEKYFDDRFYVVTMEE